MPIYDNLLFEIFIYMRFCLTILNFSTFFLFFLFLTELLLFPFSLPLPALFFSFPTKKPRNFRSGDLYVREKIRTPDTLVRSQVLYPAELRTHIHFCRCEISFTMPATGIEPVLYFYNRILSPARLPVPPRRLVIMSGTNRARTYDPLLVRQMLSQLSYDPILAIKLFSSFPLNDPEGTRTLDLRRDRAAL